MALDPGRRPSLHAAKLRGLSRSALGLELDDASGSADGALGVAGVGDAAVAVALVEQSPEQALGRVLATMKRRGTSTAHVMCAVGADLVARRAAEFSLDIKVHALSGTELELVAATPDPKPADPTGEAMSWIDTIERSGADVVVEHGSVTGEVAGLEVARVIEDEFGIRLEVGVSADDRLMFSLLHGHLAAEDAVHKIVGIVTEHRRPGAVDHPLNRLSRSRWLRSMLIERPDSIGLASLSPAPGPVARPNLKDVVPAAGLGRAADGEVVVVTSTGVDLELVAYSAHARRVLASAAPLLIVVPERDDVDFLRWSLDRLRSEATVRTVPDNWSEQLV